MEYNIGNKYIVIMQQCIQTSVQQIINRIEIGRLESETAKHLKLGNKYIKKSLIKKMIDCDCITMVNELFLIERIEGVLI